MITIEAIAWNSLDAAIQEIDDASAPAEVDERAWQILRKQLVAMLGAVEREGRSNLIGLHILAASVIVDSEIEAEKTGAIFVASERANDILQRRIEAAFATLEARKVI